MCFFSGHFNFKILIPQEMISSIICTEGCLLICEINTAVHVVEIIHVHKYLAGFKILNCTYFLYSLYKKKSLILFFYNPDQSYQMILELVLWLIYYISSPTDFDLYFWSTANWQVAINFLNCFSLLKLQQKYWLLVNTC